MSGCLHIRDFNFSDLSDSATEEIKAKLIMRDPLIQAYKDCSCVEPWMGEMISIYPIRRTKTRPCILKCTSRSKSLRRAPAL